MTEDDYKKYLEDRHFKQPKTVDDYVNSMKDLLVSMLNMLPHNSKRDPFDEFQTLKELLDYLNGFINKGKLYQDLLSEKLSVGSGAGSAALGHYIDKLQVDKPGDPDNYDDIKAKILDLRKQSNISRNRNNANNTNKNKAKTETEKSENVDSSQSGGSNSALKVKNIEEWPLQIIFYGAPGTGKSKKIKDHLSTVGEERIFRTTFHPDYDYASFVGSLKPKMKVRNNGSKDEYISYEFEPGEFTKAYIKALTTDDNVYLIIEEINRGNCAAIFGDIFQLLDRDKNGRSDYPIDADPDLSDYIKKETAAAKDEKESSDTDKKGASNEVVKLQLPSNFYIWATMNTSDQSLFPIDAAFKRRWQMSYVKNKERVGGSISINGNPYKINDIIGAINKTLKDAHLEDKEIGYYFLKDDELNAKCLVGKLIHYLYHDVYKPYGKPTVFKEHAFDSLYDNHDGINEGELENLLNGLGIKLAIPSPANPNVGTSSGADHLDDSSIPNNASDESSSTDSESEEQSSEENE